MVDLNEPRRALERLDSYVRHHDYTGYDPYDALRSPVARRLGRPRSRQALVQLVKRAPANLRRPLGVPPTKMAKALALFCSGLARADFLPDATGRRRELARTLDSTRVDGAWGYEFDVQTRWAHYPAGSPNVIATSFVVEALRDSDMLRPSDAALAWFEEHMLHPDGFVRYVPGNDILIHNANLLGARALQRLCPGHSFVPRAVETTLAARRPDGLWWYGEHPSLRWIDNFHTAYVLLALRDLEDLHPSFSTGWRDSVEAWARTCFDADGCPRYYAGRRGPIDVHNIATAVHALAAFASVPACHQLLPGALSVLLRLQRPDGAFRATRRQPPYMRWNQAHAFRALAEVLQSV